MDIEQGDQKFSGVPRMDEQTRMRWAALVEPARRAARRTQADVASAAGVSRNTLRAMEGGVSVPQADKLWAVMLELGISPGNPPEWFEQWAAVIQPLLEAVPQARRNELMGELTMRVARELASDQ